MRGTTASYGSPLPAAFAASPPGSGLYVAQVADTSWPGPLVSLFLVLVMAFVATLCAALVVAAGFGIGRLVGSPAETDDDSAD